jgi:hypothetical protein
MPMFVGRQDRIFAVDGDYIRIMPPENRNLFDTVKTVSIQKQRVGAVTLLIYSDSRLRTR